MLNHIYLVNFQLVGFFFLEQNQPIYGSEGSCITTFLVNKLTNSQLPVVVPYLLLVSRLWLSIGTSVSCHLHQETPIFLASMVYELPSLLLKDTLNKTLQVV